MPDVDTYTLLCVNADLTIYESKPGDKKAKADISVADWKEALLAINVLSRRIQALLEDVERAEVCIEVLESKVD